MSYDIRLLLVKSGECARDVAYRDEPRGEPCTAEQRARNKRIADALTAAYPEFDRFESERHFELTDTRCGTGMQVSLFCASGAIMLPHWRKENEADILERVDNVLRIVLQNSQFVAFDPQTEQELSQEGGLRGIAQIPFRPDH
ncbi:MAG TPA: hypothetical protein VD932_05960 [Aquabacterium sp.]|nr:hypothetical protein [Aquabacterium sp.]